MVIRRYRALGWFILKDDKHRIGVCHSIPPCRQNGRLFIGSREDLPSPSSIDEEECNPLTFLLFFGFTPEQVWKEAEKRHFKSGWILREENV